jgi:cystathionine beta-lyase/cystathionine gamma-synthase
LEIIGIRDPFFDIAAQATHMAIDFYVGTDEMKAGHSNVLSAFVGAHPSRDYQDVVSATLRTLLGVLHRSIAITVKRASKTMGY